MGLNKTERFPVIMPLRICMALCAALLMTMPAHGGQPSKPMHKTLKDEVVYRVSLGKPEDVKMLVERLGNPNAVDNMGWPLLAIAASRTDEAALDVVKALVELGADVNYHGGRMNYPLMFAVQSGQPEVVKYLLEQGANYRVTDPYGVKVVDFARQSGNEEVIDLIETAINEDVMNLARVRSQKYLDKITRELAFHACAMQYYTYYYASEQDPIPKSQQKATLKKHKHKVGRSIGDLTTLFRVPKPETDEIFHEARSRIFNELENLISNRWRRIKGVGKPGDMEERCNRLTEEWHEGIFDKEQLDKEL